MNISSTPVLSLSQVLTKHVAPHEHIVVVGVKETEVAYHYIIVEILNGKRSVFRSRTFSTREEALRKGQSVRNFLQDKPKFRNCSIRKNQQDNRDFSWFWHANTQSWQKMIHVRLIPC